MERLRQGSYNKGRSLLESKTLLDRKELAMDVKEEAAKGQLPILQI